MKTLSLFPLEMVAFPSQEVNLHIFEPRYKQLIRDCDSGESTFGIISIDKGNLREYGTEMKLLEIAKRYPDGRMDIKTVGVAAFRLLNYKEKMPEKLYPGGQVVEIEATDDGDLELAAKILRSLGKLFTELGVQRDLRGKNVYQIAHYVGMSGEEEYRLLTTPSEKERQVMMLIHLKKILPAIRRGKLIRERIKKNGHFRNVDSI